MSIKKLFFLTILCLCFKISQAQVKTTPFTPEQTRRLETAAKKLIEEYARSIKHLVKAPTNQIGIIADNIADFFIKGAKVQVATVHNGSKKYNLREYLTDIIPSYKAKYEDVVIYFTRISIDGTHLQQQKDSNGNTVYVGDFPIRSSFAYDITIHCPKPATKTPQPIGSFVSKRKRQGNLL